MYERTSNGRLQAVFFFVSRATYHKRLHLAETAQARVSGIVAQEMRRAIVESAERLAARGG